MWGEKGEDRHTGEQSSNLCPTQELTQQSVIVSFMWQLDWAMVGPLTAA